MNSTNTTDFGGSYGGGYSLPVYGGYGYDYDWDPYYEEHYEDY